MKQFMEIAGRRMAYLDEGQGPALLFGHSYLWDSAMWAPQIEALKEHYRCIVPELWGHGDSDVLPEGPCTLATLAPIALKKDQQLSLEGAEQVQVMGQAMLLELMFGNLIDNALRYTQVGGEVAVVVSQVGNRIRVDVRDNGPGIPTAALSRLCERFFRVNPQQGDGVGLGMAIVSRIAQLHGADLDIHNRPEGGLEVSVLLPASRQA